MMKMHTKVIGDIFQISGHERAGTESFPVMSITMHHGLIDQSDKFKKRVASVNTSNYKIVYRNELVVGFPIDEGVIGFQTKYEQAIVSPAYDIWKLKDGISCSIDFVGRYLRSSTARRVYASKMRGAVARRRSITKKDFLSIQIPFPSLDDQIRIAAVLIRVEKLIAKRKESIITLDEFLKSTFEEMFRLNTTDYKQWGVEPLNTNTEIVSGVTKGKKYKSSNLREVPYMRVANVQDGHLDLKQIKTIEVTDDEVQQYKLRIGDLLLTEGGDPDKLGRGAVWNNEIDECIHQNHIFRVRARGTSMNPIFLSSLMASKYGKSYFLRAAKQTTGIASINSTQLKAFPLIKPPLPLQNQFAAIYEEVETLNTKYSQSLTELENLYGSLSLQAFKGELDLSKVPAEKGAKVIELHGEVKGISTMTGELTISKIYSVEELIKIIQSLTGETFSFDSLMNELEKASFKEMPKYEDLKEQIYKMLDEPNPLLLQTFDKIKKKIILRANI